MTGPIQLATSRLELRRLRAGDEAAIVAYRSLPEVARFQSWSTFGAAEASALVDKQATAVADVPGTWIQLAIVHSASKDLVGDLGIHFRADEPSQVELGITMSPAHQGKGLAREAMSAVLAYVFGDLGKHRVSAVTDAKNAAAARLFERAGFRREAHHVDAVWFKGDWGSEYVFALLAHEWQSRTVR